MVQTYNLPYPTPFLSGTECLLNVRPPSMAQKGVRPEQCTSMSNSPCVVDMQYAAEAAPHGHNWPSKTDDPKERTISLLMLPYSCRTNDLQQAQMTACRAITALHFI